MDIAVPQFGEVLEQGKQATTNAVKSTVSDIAGSVKSQVGLQNENNSISQSNPQVQSTQAEPIGVSSQGINLPNEETKEMVRDFYSPTVSLTPSDAAPKTQEEFDTQQKLAKIRQELHDQVYYNPLFAYENKKEERIGEVNQKEEEQKKMMELEQKKQDNSLPISVLRAQTSAEVKLAGAG